jgi:hypothetical protein
MLIENNNSTLKAHISGWSQSCLLKVYLLLDPKSVLLSVEESESLEEKTLCFLADLEADFAFFLALFNLML